MSETFLEFLNGQTPMELEEIARIQAIILRDLERERHNEREILESIRKQAQYVRDAEEFVRDFGTPRDLPELHDGTVIEGTVRIIE